jgi:type IV pilus assembly protein PilE
MNLHISTSRKGFTLAELMVALVIVGLLTAITLPRLSQAKDRGFVATMKSDLRNFAAQEEAHFYDNNVYTPDLNTLRSAGLLISQGVTLSIAEATATGWSVIATHAQSTGVECALYNGNAAPVGGASVEGVITCQ